MVNGEITHMIVLQLNDPSTLYCEAGMVPFRLTSRDGITNSAGRSGFEFHELCRKGCTTLQERLSGCHHGLVADRHAVRNENTVKGLEATVDNMLAVYDNMRKLTTILEQS